MFSITDPPEYCLTSETAAALKAYLNPSILSYPNSKFIRISLDGVQWHETHLTIIPTNDLSRGKVGMTQFTRILLGVDIKQVKNYIVIFISNFNLGRFNQILGNIY